MLVFSIAFGGFLLLFYVSRSYSQIIHNGQSHINNTLFSPFNSNNPNQHPAPQFTFNNSNNSFAVSEFFSRFAPPENNGNWYNPLLSIENIIIFLSGIAFLINGILLLNYLNDEDKIEAKHEVYLSVLSGDEKLVYSLLKKYSGESTQREISSRLNLSTIRTHRAVSRLHSKGIVSVASFGMTNKIFLADLFDKKGANLEDEKI